MLNWGGGGKIGDVNKRFRHSTSFHSGFCSALTKAGMERSAMTTRLLTAILVVLITSNAVQADLPDGFVATNTPNGTATREAVSDPTASPPTDTNFLTKFFIDDAATLDFLWSDGTMVLDGNVSDFQDLLAGPPAVNTINFGEPIQTYTALSGILLVGEEGNTINLGNYNFNVTGISRSKDDTLYGFLIMTLDIDNPYAGALIYEGEMNVTVTGEGQAIGFRKEPHNLAGSIDIHSIKATALEGQAIGAEFKTILGSLNIGSVIATGMGGLDAIDGRTRDIIGVRMETIANKISEDKIITLGTISATATNGTAVGVTFERVDRGAGLAITQATANATNRSARGVTSNQITEDAYVYVGTTEAIASSQLTDTETLAVGYSLFGVSSFLDPSPAIALEGELKIDKAYVRLDADDIDYGLPGAAGVFIVGSLEETGHLIVNEVDVEAKGRGTDAVGITTFVGSVNGAKLEIGTVKVTSDNGNVSGIYIDGNFTPRVDSTIGEIEVISNNTRHGAESAGITVSVQTHPVTGVVSDGITDFILSNNITVTAKEGAGENDITEAYGIFVRGKSTDNISRTTINVGGEVNVNVTGADRNSGITVLHSGLTINLLDTGENSLTTHSVAVDRQLTVTGNGLADLGALTTGLGGAGQTGNIIIGTSGGFIPASTTLAFNAAESRFGEVETFFTTDNVPLVVSMGTLTVYNDGAIIVYGELNSDAGTVRPGVGKGINIFLVENTITDDQFSKKEGTTTNWIMMSAEESLTDEYLGGVLTEAHKGELADLLDDYMVIFNWGPFGNFSSLNDGYLNAMTIHNQYAVWNAVRDRMISGGDIARSACDPCAPVTCSSKSGGRDIWVNYIGRNSRYESSFNGSAWKTSMNGVQVGADLVRTKRNQFGVLFGYEGGHSINERDRVKADDTYFGFYGVHVFRGGADVRTTAGFGWQDYDMNRWGSSVETNLYTSSFKGRSVDWNIEFGKRYTRGAWSLRPVLAFDFSQNNLRGGVESGAAGNVGADESVRYAKTSYTQSILRIGSDVRFGRRNFTFNSGVYYGHDLNNDVLSAGVNGFESGLTGTDLGRDLLLLHVGGEFQVTRNLGVFLGYDGNYRLSGTKNSQSVGYVGGRVTW